MTNKTLNQKDLSIHKEVSNNCSVRETDILKYCIECKSLYIFKSNTSNELQIILRNYNYHKCCCTSYDDIILKQISIKHLIVFRLLYFKD